MKRWHQDTNSFHLIGEMTIASDDVLVLLHLPIVEQFCSYVMLNFILASSLLVELLSMEFDDVAIELRNCCGAHVKLSWLHEEYKYIIHHKYKYIARTYLLDLIGYIIFVDKSVAFISMSYLPLLKNLRMYGVCE